VTRRAWLWALLLLAGVLIAPARLHAQEQPSVPLERFMARVARLWLDRDAAGLAALAPANGRMIFSAGPDPAETVQSRHAAAALRSLFNERETVSVRPSRVTVAGGRPLQGFAEITWASRSRGIAAQQTSSIYVGAVWEDGEWRIRELRVLP
jgi:hypothetical protein